MVCVQFAVGPGLCYGGDGVRWWQGVAFVTRKRTVHMFPVDLSGGKVESGGPLGRAGEKRQRACRSTVYVFAFSSFVFDADGLCVFTSGLCLWK